jgi:hypothetical protein
MNSSGASSSARPLYRPYKWAAADFQIGLRPIKPAQWLLFDPDYAQLMHEKRARLAGQRSMFYRTLPDSLAAQRELRERVVAHLLNDHDDRFERLGSVIRSRIDDARLDLGDPSTEPLLQLSHLVQEDFMLLQEIDGCPVVTGASNAYSTSGRLVASVGHDITWAHEPVPQLSVKLGPRIDRMILSIHADTPCERFNWQLTPLAAIYFPVDAHKAIRDAIRGIRRPLRANPGLAADLLWIRVERQTLSRLPESGAVAFSLHTYNDPLASLRSDLESAAAMLSLLRAYSSERLAYAGMDVIRDAVVEWLESFVDSPA